VSERVESTTDTEWRAMYGTKTVLFVDGKGVGDFYRAGDGIWRVRLWPLFRLQGGAEVLVLSEARAKEQLREMYEWRKQDERA
jgi:hypothetical protein